MTPKIEFIALPYSAVSGPSLAEHLISELTSGRWTEFYAAVAFARASGNFQELVQAIRSFSENNGRVRLTFGADTFAGVDSGSDYAAIETILESLSEFTDVKVYLYRDPYRVFHPKVYLFFNLISEQAKVYLGSSNWSEGGLVSNVELNTSIELELDKQDDNRLFNELLSLFNNYWSEFQESDS